MFNKYKLISKFKLSNSWILLIGNGSITILNFIFVAILSHNLSPSIYGEYREIFLYLSLLITTSVAGVAQTLYYFLNKVEQTTQKLYVIAQIRFLIIAIQISLIFIIAIIFNSKLLTINISILNYLYLSIYAFFAAVTIIDINLAIILKKNTRLITTNAFWILFKIFLIIYLKKTNINLGSIFLVSAFIQFAIFFNNYLVLGKNYWGKFCSNRKENVLVLKDILKYNIPLSLSVIIGFLIINTDRLIMFLNNGDSIRFAGLSNVAFEVPLIGNIYGAFFSMALPLMVKSYQKNEIIFFLKTRFEYTKQVAILVFPVVVCFIFWHKEFIVLAFGYKYQNLTFLFAVYNLIGLLRFCSHHDILLVTKNTRYIFYFQVIEFAFHVIISFILYHFFDIYGLIYASVITNYMYMIAINFLSAKLINTSIKNILPYGFLIKQLFICLAIAFFAKWVLQPILGDNLWMIAIAIYGLIILSIRYYNQLQTSKL